MEETKLKNIIVLKDLPSNIIEEAFVIVKSNKHIKEFEKIEKTEKNNKISEKTKNINNDRHIIKEAEFVVSSYLSKLDESKIVNNSELNKNKKYKKIKIYSYISTVIILVQFIISLIK